MTQMPDTLPSNTLRPPFDPGLAALVLGSIGLALCFLPILGGPLSAAGLLFGMAGTIAALTGRRVNLRRAAEGLLLCALALGMNVLLYFTPLDLAPDYRSPPPWNRAPDAVWISPPALPGR